VTANHLHTFVPARAKHTYECVLDLCLSVCAIQDEERERPAGDTATGVDVTHRVEGGNSTRNNGIHFKKPTNLSRC
jgi:hypothetical protein